MGGGFQSGPSRPGCGSIVELEDIADRLFQGGSVLLDVGNEVQAAVEGE